MLTNRIHIHFDCNHYKLLLLCQQAVTYAVSTVIINILINQVNEY